jgi:lipid-A-disaccharide synthase
MHATHIVLINIVLGREAVPEFIQGACTPEALAGALKVLLTDQTARIKQLRDLEDAVRIFGLDQESPSLPAARAVLELAEGAPARTRSA